MCANLGVNSERGNITRNSSHNSRGDPQSDRLEPLAIPHNFDCASLEVLWVIATGKNISEELIPLEKFGVHFVHYVSQQHNDKYLSGLIAETIFVLVIRPLQEVPGNKVQSSEYWGGTTLEDVDMVSDALNRFVKFIQIWTVACKKLFIFSNI
jgi:hypothetical protein